MAFDAAGPRLGDLVTLVRGTTYKGQLLGQPGPVLLGLASIQRNGGFRNDSLKTYGGECKAKIVLRPGDMYVSLKDVTQSADLLGAVARLPDYVPSGRLTQDTVKLEFTDGSYPRDLVYWALRTPVYRSYCREYATGTTTLGLAREDFLSFVLPPSTLTSLLLVELFEALDSRIRCLEETNTTLEAIAQTLFKSWFVDFDPVHAKAEGREPDGMDAATIALFPDSFEDSPLGPIPQGWKASTLGDLCTSHGGLIQTGPFGSQLHASDYIADGIPVVMPQDIQGRRVSLEKIARVPPADAARLSRHQLIPRDIVFSRRGDVGRHAVISSNESGWLCGTGCLLVRPGSDCPSPTFLSEHLARAETIAWLQRHAVGATMPNLNTGILSALPVLDPASNVTRAFEVVAGVVEAKISLNHVAARSLAQLRDTLLPRLISGKLRLSEAQTLIEEATP